VWKLNNEDKLVKRDEMTGLGTSDINHIIRTPNRTHKEIALATEEGGAVFCYLND